MSRSLTMAVLVCACAVALVAAPVSAAPKQRAAKAHAVSGTLQKVDGQTLTLQTAKGTETVMLAASARISENGKVVQPAQLSADTGSRVTVHYTEANGQKQAQAVTITTAKRVAKK